MIISRAPVRITFGGGGTDLKSYYSKYGGFLIAAAIDKFVFVAANRRFNNSIRLSYSETEIVDKIDDIKHRIFREALRFLGIDQGIELVSIADVPSGGSGLGTSSTFTVALLGSLHAYKNDFVTQRQLAEEACHLEIDILKEPIGKQDQYIAAFGGITCLTFEKNGEVLVEPLKISEEFRENLESSLLLFHTGIERSASEILADQDNRSKKDDASIIENLHEIKKLGFLAKEILEKENIVAFGELLHVHWETKKKRSTRMTDPFINECYELARKNGAIGGKIIGAGGGGFFLFCCENKDRMKLSNALVKKGLRRMWFHFDFAGAKILINM